MTDHNDRTEVLVRLPDKANLYHLSKLLTGLCGLHRERTIRLRSGSSAQVKMLGSSLELEVMASGTTCRVAVDLHDRSDIWDSELLQHCDVYFKRGYFQSDVDHLAASVRDKVKPYGLNYACRGPGLNRFLSTTLVGTFAGPLFQACRGKRGELIQRSGIVRKFMAMPCYQSFELSPRVLVDPIILFQTRLWEQDETWPDNAEQINCERVELVRCLRRRFGKQFVGGLIPTPLAVKHYPDAITDQPTKKSAYVAMTRRALIAIYTRGLNHSTAFKLPEFLAGSKAIVASGLRHQTPQPLRDGTHYLQFTTPQQCADRCAELLSDPDRTVALRTAGHEYYRANIAPGPHTENLLSKLPTVAGHKARQKN